MLNKNEEMVQETKTIEIMIDEMKSNYTRESENKFCPIPKSLINITTTKDDIGFDKNDNAFIYVLPTLMSLKANYNTFTKHGLISLEYIVKENGMITPIKMKVKKQFIFALKQLQKTGLIEFYCESVDDLKVSEIFGYKLSDWLLNPNVSDNNESFVKLTYNEYYRLLNKFRNDKINKRLNKILIILYLKSYIYEGKSKEGKSFNNKTHYCSYDTIAESIGVGSDNTIAKYVDELEKQDRIIIKENIGTKQNTKSSKITNYPIIYTFAEFENWKMILEHGINDMIESFKKVNEIFYGDTSKQKISPEKQELIKLSKQKGAYSRHNNIEKVEEIDNKIQEIKQNIDKMCSDEVEDFETFEEIDFDKICSELNTKVKEKEVEKQDDNEESLFLNNNDEDFSDDRIYYDEYGQIKYCS